MKYGNVNRPQQCMMTQSTCYKGTSTMTVRGVLWHSTGADNPYLKRYVQPDDNASDRDMWLRLLGVNTNRNDWNHQTVQAGLNCWVGKLENGTVTTVQTMPWDYAPWGCGSGPNGSCNNGWIQFEICEDGLNDLTYFTAAYTEACEITAYLCAMFNLDPHGTVSYAGKNVPVILCHKDSNGLGLGSNHADVLHWFPKFGKSMEDVRNDVASLMNGASISVSGIASNLGALGRTGTPYYPRLTRPEAGNKYYITKARGGYSNAIQGKPTDPDCDVLANCVGYAYGRFNEIGGYGECKYLTPTNAENFIEHRGNLSYGQEPKLGACMVWQKGATLSGGDGAGHVAIVEQINSPTEIVTSESGWNSSAFWTKTRQKGNGNWGASSGYTFRGFIYNPAVGDDAYVYGSSGSGGITYVSRPMTFADIGIDEANVAPYIVTVDPSVDPEKDEIDYGMLKSFKVSGLLLFAGQRYRDGTHIKTNVFRATNLRKQVESCQDAEMPFALYTKVLSRNLDEAKEELQQLYFTVSRYPPGLGLWLQLKFPNSQTVTKNDEIIEYYYDQTSKWGLFNGIGFYLTESELEQITWEDFQDRFQLWLRKPASSVSEAQSIGIVIEPNLFKLS